MLHFLGFLFILIIAILIIGLSIIGSIVRGIFGLGRKKRLRRTSEAIHFTETIGNHHVPRPTRPTASAPKKVKYTSNIRNVSSPRMTESM